MEPDSGSDFIYEDSLVKTEARRVAFLLSQGKKASITVNDRAFSKQVLAWLPHYIDLVNSDGVEKGASGSGHLHFDDPQRGGGEPEVGESPGHPFRGNQYNQVEQGTGEDSPVFRRKFARRLWRG